MRTHYVCKYYFNASHSFKGDIKSAHSHTFTMTLYVGRRKKEDETDIEFVDHEVASFLEEYEERYLNDLPGFEGKDGSLETIGEVFYEKIKRKLRGTPFSLYQLDIAESPLFVYQVADQILLPTLNMENTKGNYDAILMQKQQLEHLKKRG